MDWSSSTRSLGQAHVGGDHGAERQLHHIARHEFGSGYGRPDIIATDRRVQREPRFQRSKSRLRTPFLEKPESGIEHQENHDDQGLDILAKYQLEHDRSFEHPWNRRPELGQAPCVTVAEPCRALRLDRTSRAGGELHRSLGRSRQKRC